MKINEFIAELERSLEGVQGGSLSGATLFRELPVWDSLAALSTLSAVDTVFGIQMSGEQLKACQTIQDVFDLAVRVRNGL